MKNAAGQAPGPPDWVLAGKLAPPQQVVETAQRQALLTRLAQHQQKRVLVVVAPAGFGKTTLLSQWWTCLRTQPGHSAAWLSLDEADAEPGRFLAYLILALEQAGLAMGDVTRMAQKQAVDSDIRRTTLAVIQVLQKTRRACTLVLDDYHRASSEAVDAVLRQLIEAELPRLQLVLGSRQRPRLQVSALKARGLVHSVDAHDLVLSQAEAAEVLGRDLNRSDLAIIHARTEGWAVALQLARIWLEQNPGSAVGLQAFGGQSADVAEYLTEQLVGRLAPDLQAFLYDTALLESFSPAMANAVREANDSLTQLARLSDFEALLLPLSPERNWFRYHTLFADYLRQRIEPRHAQRIHAAAARWLGEQGDTIRAVGHALQAQDTALAVQMVRQSGGWELVLWRGMRYAQSVLSQFPDRSLRSEPVLLLMQAYLHAKVGHEELALEMLRLAEWGLGKEAGLARDFKVIQAIVLGYFDRFEKLDQWPASAAAADAHLPQDNLGQGSLLCASSLAHFAWGQLESAVRIARLAGVRMRLADSPLGENYCLAHEALAHAMAGDVAQSHTLINQALALADINFGAESSLKAIVGCYKAQHLYWQGRWDEVDAWIDAAQDTILHTDGWFDVYASACEVQLRLCWRRHGMDRASQLLTEVAQFARARQLPRLLQLTQAWRVDLLAQSGLGAQARREAHAADLAALARGASRTGMGWRIGEAAVLALARMHMATGVPHQARSVLAATQAAFQAQGLRLPLWRVQLLDFCAQKRSASSATDLRQWEALLSTLLANEALGLICEAGPDLLPWLQRISVADFPCEPARWQALLQRLTEWQGGPQGVRAGLSAKELEVLAMLARGLANKQMARELDLSENTVKFHLKQIFAKLKVDNRVMAVSVARKSGLVETL